MPPQKISPCPYSWLNGGFVDKPSHELICLGVFSQAFSYARIVWDALRVSPHFQFEQNHQLLIFALEKHLNRFYQGCQEIGLIVPFDRQRLHQATQDVVRLNSQWLVGGGYLRIFGWDGDQALAPRTAKDKTQAQIAICVAPLGEYVPAADQPFEAIVYPPPRTVTMKTKASANYRFFADARDYAHDLGYHDAIMTALVGNQQLVAEATTSNLLVVLADSQIVTPTLQAMILPGITREVLLEVGSLIDCQIVEKDISASELYNAREIASIGTASYVRPFTSISGHQLETKVGWQLDRFLREIMRGEEFESLDYNTVVTVNQLVLDTSVPVATTAG